MAVYKIFPEKDTTIYSEFPNKNTGIDEILEISTFYNTVNPQVSRALIQFSQNDLVEFINKRIGSQPYTASLKLFIADIEGINTDRDWETVL